MSSAYTRDDLFKNDVPPPDVIKQIDSQPESWAYRVDAGWKLVWKSGFFSPKKGAPAIRRVYVTWIKPDGSDINAGHKTLPVTDIVSPTGPIKKGAFYVKVPDDVFRFNEDVERAVQKIEFDVGPDADKSNCPNWDRFATAMDKLFVDDLADYLVHNVDDHDLLNDGDRALVADEGPEAAAKALKRMMLDGMNRSYHRYGWAAPKHKILRQRYPRAGGAELVKVAPKDADLLARPEYSRILDHINKSAAFWTINLLPIFLPDGTEVGPDEYDRLNGNGALATMTLTIFGVNRRPDGQHSIMGSNSGTHLVTNGSSAQSTGPTLNIMAMRGKRRADEPHNDHCDAKRPAPASDDDDSVCDNNSP